MDSQDFSEMNPLPGRQKKPKKKWGLIAAAAVAVVAAIVVGVLLLTGSLGNRDQNADDHDNPDVKETTEDRLVSDLDAYFSQRGKLLRKIPVADSKTVRDEAAIASEINSRGFSEYMITAEYTMDGTIYEEAEITAEAGTKHPIYNIYIITAGGDYWLLTEVNGTLIAIPVSYNLNSGLDVQVVIAETDTIMSYDSQTGLFYETIPDPSALIVKKVDRIDAETLEKLTAEEVEKL